VVGAGRRAGRWWGGRTDRQREDRTERTLVVGSCASCTSGPIEAEKQQVGVGPAARACWLPSKVAVFVKPSHSTDEPWGATCAGGRIAHAPSSTAFPMQAHNSWEHPISDAGVCLRCRDCSEFVAKMQRQVRRWRPEPHLMRERNTCFAFLLHKTSFSTREKQVARFVFPAARA
jgi:hypothetical protein